MARAELVADSETAEDCRQHTAWSTLAGWRQSAGPQQRLGASWCSAGAGLAAAGAYLVLYLLYMSWLDSLAWASWVLGIKVARLGSQGLDTSYLVQNKQAECKLGLAADGPAWMGSAGLEAEEKLGW